MNWDEDNGRLVLSAAEPANLHAGHLAEAVLAACGAKPSVRWGGKLEGIVQLVFGPDVELAPDERAAVEAALHGHDGAARKAADEKLQADIKQAAAARAARIDELRAKRQAYKLGQGPDLSKAEAAEVDEMARDSFLGVM